MAQATLTQIQDTVRNPDGTLFSGTVVIVFNGFTTPGTTAPQSTSAQIYTGALSVLLVPTTTASPGAYYQAIYNSSNGLVTWTETWSVPPSSTPVTLSQIRTSTTQGSGSGGTGGGSGGTGGGTGGGSGGTGGSSGGGIALPIQISDVTGLPLKLDGLNASMASLTTTVNDLTTSVSSDVSSISTLSTMVNGLNTTVTGTSNAVGTLSNTVTGLTTTVTGINDTLGTLSNTVAGLTTTVTGNNNNVGVLSNTVTGLTSTVSGIGTAVTTQGNTLTTLDNTVTSLGAQIDSITAGSTTAVFADGETPSGAMDGNNGTFALAAAPAPAASLQLYRNGLQQMSGVDFTLAGSTITFLNSNVPKASDIVQAFYRVPGTGQTSTFTDAEVPSGTVNGTNPTFTIAAAPNPVFSLRLFKNGMLLAQNADYTITGTALTFTSAQVTPQVGDSIIVYYRH
ncbi:MAG: hypothetical protein ACR2JB_07455 [Bryobacteraceae bacterium]